ncbi:alpha/beta hydrolase-fold protein, partial [Treponema sp.]|uniref:alpha/beta hydrolase n=1 Tax=Treponema sp. TaxID=166 RepID=UPI0025F094FD
MTQSFKVEGRYIELFESQVKESPLVILNTFETQGQKVYQECINSGTKEFTLAAISNLDWDSDMTPWPIPPIYKKGSPCSGQADQYLKILTEKIIPQIQEKLKSKPSYIAIAGYSLGGLFALYAIYKTDIFAKAASASGSLWFPRFIEFAESTEFIRQPECIYLSLGDSEASTKNK